MSKSNASEQIPRRRFLKTPARTLAFADSTVRAGPRSHDNRPAVDDAGLLVRGSRILSIFLLQR